MYVKKCNIPLIIIMNRMYKNQSLYIVPMMIHTIECINSIISMAIGCFIFVYISRVIDSK
jgi:hypothetical protein